ncbi:MAG: hypothetical protein WC989_03205 [Micavibrio sp.]
MMNFKSYDGWVGVDTDDVHPRKMILARFTKQDGEQVHYNLAALRRMQEKPSAAMTKPDLHLVRMALDNGPSYFKSFDGWKRNGRILLAHFTKATGGGRYSQSGLSTMERNPPKKFSEFDMATLRAAMDTNPARRP